jgi:hypothetical protein
MNTRILVRRVSGPILGAGGGYLLHYLAACRGGG